MPRPTPPRCPGPRPIPLSELPHTPGPLPCPVVPPPSFDGPIDLLPYDPPPSSLIDAVNLAFPSGWNLGREPINGLRSTDV